MNKNNKNFPFQEKLKLVYKQNIGLSNPIDIKCNNTIKLQTRKIE